MSRRRRPFLPSELVLNEDGSVYHLHVLNEHIADRVILVGDPKRVDRVSEHFDTIDYRICNREFCTHTGKFKGTPVTAMSTGIGTDNIDIVLNELDAAVNINPIERIVKDTQRRLAIVRIGTSGAIREEIPVDSFLFSSWGLSLDTLMHYYERETDAETDALEAALRHHLHPPPGSPSPIAFRANPAILQHMSNNLPTGITATAPGFFAPQGRTLRLPCAWKNMHDELCSFRFRDLRITNFEMETSALYGLGSMLGHLCCTACVVIANRRSMQFSADYQKPVGLLIEEVLKRLIRFHGMESS